MLRPIFLFLAAMLLFSPTAARSAPPLKEMIGQMLLVGFRGLDVSENSPIMQDIRERNLGGVLLFDYDVGLDIPKRNIESPGQVRSLVRKLKRAAGTPLLVAIDVEGGRINRLKPEYGFPDTLSAQSLGEQNDPEATRAQGKSIARTLLKLGITMDLAPVVDLNTNPGNPAIGRLERSFSADPAVVTTQAKAFIKGLHGMNILSCLKHFPGHGSSYNDSHLGLTDITSTWTPAELAPYRNLIAAGSVDAIMTGHLFNENLDPVFPATLSFKTMTGLLRGRLGYQGVIISDDMQMKAITNSYGLENAIFLAINAGVDILIFGNNLVYDPDIVSKAVTMVARMVEKGRLTPQRIEESYKRIMALKKGMNR